MIRGQTPYAIRGFGRVSGAMGGCGFTVCVPIEFATEAEQMDRSIPEVDFMLQEYAKEIWPYHMPWLSELGGNGRYMLGRAFHFEGNSYLLRNLSVPGNACGLDYDERGHGPWHRASYTWTPHNVDSLGQASALLAMWLRWFEAFEAIL